MAAEVVVELAVAVVVEVEVAVTGDVPFGHPRPPKMSTIISITLSDKVIVLKKSIIINLFMQYADYYYGVPVRWCLFWRTRVRKNYLEWRTSKLVMTLLAY